MPCVRPAPEEEEEEEGGAGSGAPRPMRMPPETSLTAHVSTDIFEDPPSIQTAYLTGWTVGWRESKGIEGNRRESEIGRKRGKHGNPWESKEARYRSVRFQSKGAWAWWGPFSFFLIPLCSLTVLSLVPFLSPLCSLSCSLPMLAPFSLPPP